MTRDELFSSDNVCFPGLVSAHGRAESLSDLDPGLRNLLQELARQDRVYAGKVRDRIDLGDSVLMYTSDRVSAFDRILGMVPFKGEILNRISLFWFGKTRDIVRNHVIRQVGGRGLLARRAKVLPVEVVVRGYLTGSAWRDYQAGKPVSGVVLPAGMKKDQAFQTPIITPSTKEAVGSHDVPISTADIVARGIVSAAIWQAVEQAAIGLFTRGTEIALERGLLLVDTKYEFGILPGMEGPEGLILVDEIHTPDSSRFWYADGYDERLARGDEQKRLDKEYLRSWLMDRGWSGDGTPPEIPREVYTELAWRYIQAYQEITGEDFAPFSVSGEAEAALVASVLSETV